MAIGARRLRYEDYVRLSDDGRRWELITGEAYVVPGPTAFHQELVAWLHRVIADHLDRFGGGRVFIAPFDVRLTDEDVVQPDLVFVGQDQLEIIEEKLIRGAPAWVIEVVSDPVRDKKVKRELYLRSGVREYWAVDPDLRWIEVYRPGVEVGLVSGSARLRPEVLSALEINLETLFSRPGG
jgi:Uma2 family endonuclease